jgi:hypothetical protein
MCSGGSTTIMLWWVSPFGHPRINAWEATPRGLSQPPTSFIGFRRQGIHRWLFVAWKNKRCSCSLWNSQRARRTPPEGGVGRWCGQWSPSGRHANQIDPPRWRVDRSSGSNAPGKRNRGETDSTRPATRGRLPEETWPAKVTFDEEPSS